MKVKKLTAVLFVITISINLVSSQVPKGFSYQAVIRDGNGSPIANSYVGVKIALENASSVTYYSETFRPQSNSQGVISVVIGTGTKVGVNTFESIPWKNGDVFIKIEIDPSGGTSYSPIGAHTQLQSVPYALYAENTKEIVSDPTALDDDPIFEVKNKLGQVVFGVYQSGVRVYVEDAQIKGAKGGFAVGGLTNQAKSGQAEYFRITPDSARIYVKEVPSAKGAKGGFAVGGLTNQAKGIISRNMMFVAPDSTRIYVNPTASKGAKGGFAIGGLTNQSKGSSGNFLDLTPENSFIGQDAGKSNTTGVRNAFVGYQAGLMNDVGNDNIFIGNTAGLGNTSGTDNIFLGTGSGKSNISGARNVFLGVNSGQQNATGWQNVLIGEQSGYSLQTGVKNIFIGAIAGFSNISGTDNVFIGNAAGNQSTGNSNVYIGRMAGVYNTVGVSNVYIGEQSGANNLEGSGNVFIGKGAGYSETGSNKLYISNSNTTAPLIYGEFDNSKVAINGSVKLKELMNLQPKTTYPGNPAEGDVFYDANNHCLNFYNGTQWMKLSAVAASSPPYVSTVSIPPISILASSCTINCNISILSGTPITQSGVRYSLTPFFDIPSTSVVLYSTPGVGDFNVTLTGLIQKRVYYVRAFATNSQGTSLGNMMTFTTPAYSALPTITSNPVTNITQTTAVGGGNVTMPGGYALTALGICWSTTSNPSITDNIVPGVVGLGAFTGNLTGLIAGTTYYVRAYATNANGTAYGNEVVFNTASTVTTMLDVEGNSYNTVQIGTQTWMKENLKTTKYRDGTDITNITDDSQWNNQTSEAYCWYDNDIANKNTYGALYNFYAVVDSHNLCPTGWHIPTDVEWTYLSNYLGGDKVAGGRLKETGTTHWSDPNTGADNSSGFTALPGGSRYNSSFGGDISYYGYWWSATQDATYAWASYLDYSTISITRYEDVINNGFSVRCLKDQ